MKLTSTHSPLNDQLYSPEEHAVYNSFLNALLRELPQHKAITRNFVDHTGRNTTQTGIELQLKSRKISLWLPLKHYSKFHYHEFSLPVMYSIDFGPWHTCDLLTIAQYAITEKKITERLAPWIRQPIATLSYSFQKKVAASAEQILLACADFQKKNKKITDFATAEQGLLFGHVAHPYPKYREGFSSLEARQYMPDYGAQFSLLYVAVSEKLIWSTAKTATVAQRYLNHLIEVERERFSLSTEQYGILPMHPWQWGKLLCQPTIQVALGNNEIKVMGFGQKKWLPTSSVRALYHPDSPYMMKFSISSQITNSTRTLTESEVTRGVWVMQAFDSAHGQQLIKRCSNLTLIHEPVAFGIKIDSENVIPESLFILRENPFPAGSNAFMVAALCQPPLSEHTSLLRELVYRYEKQHFLTEEVAAEHWFGKYLEIAIRPFVIALSDFGFAFSAHQQNMIVGMDDGLPARVYFRDCQGTAFTTEAIEKIRGDTPGFSSESMLNIEREELYRIAAYHLFSNNVFSVMAALHREKLINEKKSILLLRSFLTELEEELDNTTFTRYVLRSQYIFSKGNFALSLISIDESQAPSASLSSYTPMPNPLI